MHYTVADYKQWEGEWELWSGVAVAMTPSPFGNHQKLIAKLSQHFLNAIEQRGCDDCDVVVELDWVVSDETVVRPDVSIVCGSDLQRFIDHPPVVIVEVLSESTRHKDTTSKFDLYEQQGVKYYLTVDPVTKLYEGFELHDKSYRSIAMSTHMTFELNASCTITLPLPT